MIQNRLPDRLLLDRTENLMLTDPASTRLSYQRLAPVGQPLRPPVVHGLERDLEHRRDILASPARHQRGHRPQPKGLLRRRRQLPRIPHEFAHAGANDPEHLPFRINNTAIGWHRTTGATNITRATRQANRRSHDLITAVTSTYPRTQ